MTLEAKSPVWAILAPLNTTVLSRFADGLQYTTVSKGTARHSAIVNRMLGSEGLDQDLVEHIGAAYPDRELILLRLREDVEAIWVYRGDQRIREENGSPWDLARKLGCPLRPENALRSPTKTVCVVSGQDPASVAKSLGLKEVPASGPMYILPCPLGSYFYSDGGNVSLFVDDVARLTTAPIYLLSARYGGREFFCSVTENGTEVGVYEIPIFKCVQLPQLHSILGRTRPTEILSALGVPPHILDIEA